MPPTFAWKVALVWDSSQRAEANCVAAKHTQLGLFASQRYLGEGSAMLETTFSMQLWLHPATHPRFEVSV
jgi:hypothetical protein